MYRRTRWVIASTGRRLFLLLRATPHLLSTGGLCDTQILSREAMMYNLIQSCKFSLLCRGHAVTRFVVGAVFATFWPVGACSPLH